MTRALGFDPGLDFRFSARRVRKAGLPSTPYAKALRALWKDTRTVKDMQRVFSRAVMQYLERNGFVRRTEDGLYVLTPVGPKTLHACGYPPAGKTNE